MSMSKEPSAAEDILTDLTEQRPDGIRRRVRAGVESIDVGKYTEYDGREGLKELADEVKARGRRLRSRSQR
jgi:hypothetical protein